ALGVLRALQVPLGQPRPFGRLLARGPELLAQVLALLAELGDLPLQQLVGASRRSLVLAERLVSLLEPCALFGDALQLCARDLQRELILGQLRGSGAAISTAALLHALGRSGQLELGPVGLEQEARRAPSQDVDRD